MSDNYKLKLLELLGLGIKYQIKDKIIILDKKGDPSFQIFEKDGRTVLRVNPWDDNQSNSIRPQI